MSNKQKILELVKQGDLTIEKIASELKITENETRTYINRLKSDALVKEIGKEGRYKIYTAIIKEQKPENDELKTVLRVYHKMFETLISKHFSLISDNAPEILEYINSHEEFNKIGDLL